YTCAATAYKALQEKDISAMLIADSLHAGPARYRSARTQDVYLLWDEAPVVMARIRKDFYEGRSSFGREEPFAFFMSRQGLEEAVSAYDVCDRTAFCDAIWAGYGGQDELSMGVMQAPQVDMDRKRYISALFLASASAQREIPAVLLSDAGAYRFGDGRLVRCSVSDVLG
ncbi:MAG: hypothetical protein ACOCWQ_03760, partial [Nanoarchaeota archaeon]